MRILLTLLCLSAWAGDLHESTKRGGTLRFRRRETRWEERRNRALAVAEGHCRANGYTTYEIADESDEDRYRVIEFKCK